MHSISRLGRRARIGVLRAPAAAAIADFAGHVADMTRVVAERADVHCAGAGRPARRSPRMIVNVTCSIALCAAITAASAALLAPTADAKRRAAAPVVLQPHKGARLPARPVEVRLRGGNYRLAQARLNGRPIRRFFPIPREGHNGFRRLSVSATHGLRHGRNLLRVVFRRGRRVVERNVRFRVVGAAPLVGAGFDRRVPVGESVRVKASRREELRYRWKIVRKPRGAHWVGPRNPAPTLAKARSARPIVQPDVPGRYLLRLTATTPDGSRGTDMVAVKADEEPLVQVDTIAKRGNEWGIRVGDQFIPYGKTQAGAPHPWLQTAVFDRETLAYLPNLSHTYQCASAKSAEGRVDRESWVTECIESVRKSLRDDKLIHDETNIVIAGSPPSGVPPVGAGAALQELGAHPLRASGDNSIPLTAGTYSAIAIPDHEGHGTVHQNAGGVLGSQRAGDGNLAGDLVRSNLGDYGFSARKRLTFDTQAPGSVDGGGTGDRSVIRVGDQVFTMDQRRCCGWWHVVVADDQTLQGQQHAFFGNDSPSLIAFRDVLRAANDSGGKLVFISSRGLGYENSLVHEFRRSDNFVVREIADQIEHLGGTRTYFFDTIDIKRAKGRTYTLVGGSRLENSNGIETQGQGPEKAGALNAAPVQGYLVRDRNWRWRPRVPEAGGLPPDAGDHIVNTIHQDPVPWPEDGNAGRTAAVKWIGQKVPLLGSADPRAQYWSRPYTFESWEGIRKDVKAVAFEPGHGFSESDLAWARNEIDQEIDWLEAVYANMKAYAQPFAGTSFSQWAKLEEVARTVNLAAHVADTRFRDSVDASLSTLVKTALSTATAILGEKGGQIFHFLHGIYDFALEVTQISNEAGAKEDDLGERYATTTSKLGIDLARRMEAMQDFLSSQAPQIIVSDYGKLKLVGSCFRGHGCPTPLSEWHYTQTELAKAAARVKDGAEAHMWGRLLGTKYTAWRLPGTRYHDAKDVRLRYVTGSWPGLRCPFLSAPATAIQARPLQIDLSSQDRPQNHLWDVRVLGQLVGQGVVGDLHKMVVPGNDPATERPVTDRVFNPPSEGGLGMYPEAFLYQYFDTRSDLHYPYRDTAPGRFREDTWDTCGE